MKKSVLNSAINKLWIHSFPGHEGNPGHVGGSISRDKAGQTTEGLSEREQIQSVIDKMRRFESEKERKAAMDKMLNMPNGIRVVMRNGQLGNLEIAQIDNGTSNRRIVKAYRIKFDVGKPSPWNAVRVDMFDSIDPAYSWHTL